MTNQECIALICEHVIFLDYGKNFQQLPFQQHSNSVTAIYYFNKVSQLTATKKMLLPNKEVQAELAIQEAKIATFKIT